MFLRIMRALATAAAGAWLGGMIMIAVVAQTTFAVMRTTDVALPNTIAGRVMARNFSRFDILQLICGGLLLLWQGTALAMGQRKRRDLVRAALIAVAAGLLSISVLIMTPKIVAMQPALASQGSDAAVKQAFDEFHATAVRVSQATLLVVFVILMEMTWSSGKEGTSA